MSYANLSSNSKEVFEWDNNEVITWLLSKNMRNFTESFEINQINGYDLYFLTGDDLKNELKINKLHDRLNIIREIRKLILLGLKLTFSYENEKHQISLDFDVNFTLAGLLNYIGNIIRLASSDGVIVYDSEMEILSPNCRIVELSIINPKKYKNLIIKTKVTKISTDNMENKNNSKYYYLFNTENKENEKKSVRESENTYLNKTEKQENLNYNNSYSNLHTNHDDDINYSQTRKDNLHSYDTNIVTLGNNNKNEDEQHEEVNKNVKDYSYSKYINKDRNETKNNNSIPISNSNTNLNNNYSSYYRNYRNETNQDNNKNSQYESTGNSNLATPNSQQNVEIEDSMNYKKSRYQSEKRIYRDENRNKVGEQPHKDIFDKQPKDVRDEEILNIRDRYQKSLKSKFMNFLVIDFNIEENINSIKEINTGCRNFTPSLNINSKYDRENNTNNSSSNMNSINKSKHNYYGDKNSKQISSKTKSSRREINDF